MMEEVDFDIVEPEMDYFNLANFEDDDSTFVYFYPDRNIDFKFEETEIYDYFEDLHRSLEAENNNKRETRNKKRTKFTVFVKGLNRNKVSYFFSDCKINSFTLLKNRTTNKLTGSALVDFKDEESKKKALKKNETELNGRLIRVEPVKEKHNVTKECAVLVIGLNPNSNVKYIFQECYITSFKFLTDHKTNKLTGRTLINLEDNISLKRALSKNETEIDGCIITVEPTIDTRKQMTIFSAFIEGFNSNTKIQDIFQDCKIQYFKMLKDRKTNEKACVHFENKKSLEKALSKHETEVDGHTLIVEPTAETRRKMSKFSAVVSGLSSNTKIRDIFQDCKLQYFYRARNQENELQEGAFYVHFKDEKSLKKALLKDEKEYDGSVIKVYDSNLSVFVSNLSPDSKVQDLFKDCTVHSFEIVKDKKTNKSTGKNMIVNFKDMTSVQKALSRNNIIFNGRNIKVEMKKCNNIKPLSKDVKENATMKNN